MIFMAIQLPDVGTGVPADKTGDSPWLAMKKVRENFNDPTNAANKIVGSAKGQIPLAEDIFKVSAVGNWSSITDTNTYASVNDFPVGSQFTINSTDTPTLLNMPSGVGTHIWGVSTISSGSSSPNKLQIAVSLYGKPVMVYRIQGISMSYGDWIPIGYNPVTYSTTTASGANVVVDTTGKLMRSTSSERYKDILAPLELDDARYADAMALRPIIYRSTADADNPAYHYYSFSAEELGAHDPAFTLWRETETVTDADGNVTEQSLDERVAEGININAIVAFLHATNVKQDKIIKSLEARIEAIENK